MSIKLLLLSTNETLIGDIKEVSSDDKFVGYLISDPQIVGIRRDIILCEDPTIDHSESELQVSLTSWTPLSSDNEIFIYPSSVISLMEPISNIIQMYEDKVNGQSN
jgi:hypothetical protein